jgi:lactate racemase
MSVIGIENTKQYLSDEQIESVVQMGLDSLHLDGKRVLVIIPDSTRTMPLPLFFRLITRHLMGKAKKLDFMIALGTHPAMSEPALLELVGISAEEKAERYAKVDIINHAWKDPQTLTILGNIPSSEISELSGGLLEMDVPVRLNKRLLDYDEVLICGPVFPHEVVGFSGGNKYFFPGVAGPEVINFSHWLGAVITSWQVIGTKTTPVRAVINKAASFIDVPKLCFSMVVKGHHDLVGLYFGTPEDAYDAAADLSAQHHVIYVEKPFKRVLSVMPELYDDIWTAAKGMYKMEPAIADGGEVIIYAPHIDEISYTHGKILDEVGYHCRDYFLRQWERFKDYPWGVLAHCTHVSGMGAYDAETGVEQRRITVTLATRVPPERCAQINLGYLDPDSINLDEWQDREDEGILLVPRAGEMLYRLKE